MNCITKLNILLRLTNPDTIFVLYAYFGKILVYRVDSIFLLIQYRNKASFLLIIRMLIGKFNA